MAEIKLLKISFTKQDLRILKEEEKIFLLQLGGILQEVATLQKLIIMSSKGVPESVERMAENSQAMYFMRLLASTLHEGWKVLCHRKYKDITIEYKNLFDNTAISALDSFKNYFRIKNNLCTNIRNNYFYHYNYGKISSAFQKLPSNDLLEIYLSENHANCRYLASDTIINSGMLDINNVDDFSVNLPLAIDEILKVAKWFMEFVGEYISKILLKVKSHVNDNTHEIILSNVPDINELRLHYFINSSD